MLDNFDKQEAIDDSRDDSAMPVVTSFSILDAEPLTDRGLRYPRTLVIRIGAGRLPDWLKPYFGGRNPPFRRLQTRKDPNYGFTTPNYSSFGNDAYVARSPGDSTELRKRILDDATKAGWRVPKGMGPPCNEIFLCQPIP